MELKAVNYFGYKGIDLIRLKKNMPFAVGDKIDRNDVVANRKKVFDAVLKSTGKGATDAAFITLNQNMVLFVGVAGDTYKPEIFKSAPSEKITLPNELIICYRKQMDAIHEVVTNGSKEHRSISEKLDDEIKVLSKPVADQLVNVLLNAADPEQRYVAAYCLGLVASNKSELDALASAAKDPDSTVRNNAVRELCESAMLNPELAKKIDPSCFIQMLGSGTWTDRNKSTFMLETLTRTENKAVMDKLRVEAVPTLIEMARWNKEHARPSLVILGRIANLNSSEISKLIDENQSEQIIEAAEKTAKSL